MVLSEEWHRHAAPHVHVYLPHPPTQLGVWCGPEGPPHATTPA
jgi:hypothetical protein